MAWHKWHTDPQTIKEKLPSLTRDETSTDEWINLVCVCVCVRARARASIRGFGRGVMAIGASQAPVSAETSGEMPSQVAPTFYLGLGD